MFDLKKKLALESIDMLHSEILEELTGGATISERDTWSTKEAAAKAYLDGERDTVAISMLTIEAGMSGITVLELSEKIILRGNQFKILVGTAAGLRKMAKTLIEDSTNEEELEYILKSVQKRVEEEILSRV